MVTKYLGPPKIVREKDSEIADIGIVNGLAWTETGGETLIVEVNTMPGKGNLQLTGQLGDVMKESAHAALGLIKWRAKDFGLEEDTLANTDIHVHYPQGGIPKDGPSAGITMATAIISRLTGIPIRKDVAMTGEITLTGRTRVAELKDGAVSEYLLDPREFGLNYCDISALKASSAEESATRVRAVLAPKPAASAASAAQPGLRASPSLQGSKP